MKKILAMAAAAALTCGVSAYAANPFSDVSAGDWAYQAVTSLSEQGVVEGYPDGTFKGQQNITRYEMAQIIARMLAKEDQYNAQQRAIIDRLASEYADELNNLGVRVSNLEKRVGNVRFTGDSRMRYIEKYSGTKANDYWNGRIRLSMKANVNDSTYVYGRFLSTMDFVSEADATTSMDRLFIHHKFSDNIKLTLGRSELWMGSTGIFYDDAFDGARLKMGTEKVNLEAGYGRFKLWHDTVGDALNTTAGNQSLFANTNPDAWYVSAKGQVGPAVIGVDYLALSSKVSDAAVSGSGKYQIAGAQPGDDYKFWGANLNIPVNQFALFGDYYKNTGIHGDPQFYTAGLSYGKAVGSKPGTFKLSAQYVKAESGSYLGGTALQIDPTAVSLSKNTKDVKYWLAMADVILMKNLKLHGEYAFNVKADKTGGETDYDDLATVSLNYSF